MKSKLIFAAGVMAILTFVFFFRQMPAQMRQHSQSATEDSEKIIINRVRQNDFVKLREKAWRNGSVRIIVGLSVNSRPEGEINSKAELTRQRAAIKKTQDNLLDQPGIYGARGVKRFEFIPFLALEADAALLEKLNASPFVTSIREDRFLSPSIAESVPLVGAPGGVANGFSGSGQTVAILDTGVDKNHSYFAGGKVVSEACYSTNMGTNPDFDSTVSLCPGGVSESTAPDSGLHCDTSQIGVCWHGTHVAGIAAGREASLGHFGVSRDASIIAIQVFSRYNNPGNCGGFPPCLGSYNSDIIKALERVYALRTTFNIAAVNMSFGDGNFTSYCDNEDVAMKAAIDNLRSVNIASVIASGNNGTTSALNFPACISSAISVGSTNDGSNFSTLNAISNFSSSADFLNLYAPGLSIISASPNNQLRSSAGTSMAAPHVAGAWADLKQQNPNATVSQILTALATTGRVITDSRTGANNRKTPRIRVDSASQQLAGTNCVRTPITTNQFINAALDAGDCASETGVNRDLYAFSGTAGTRVAILMTSPDFDTYLYLLDPNGRIIAYDDNSGGGTNARIPASGDLTLPLTGSYTILATKIGASLSFMPEVFSPQNGNYQITMLAPTAAGVTLGGRVSTANGGLGISNATIFITDPTGEKHSTLTNSFGYFSFENVRAGETYVFEIKHKRYSFVPQAIFINEDLIDLNFTAE